MYDFYQTTRVKQMNKYRSLIAYALAKTMYERQRDILDALVPFILLVLGDEDNKPLKENQIQKKLAERFDLNIPMHTLRSILTRSKRQGYINQENYYICLLGKGYEYMSKMPTERQIHRNIQCLLEELGKEFVAKGNERPSNDALMDLLMTFIKTNLYSLLLYFSEDEDNNNLSASNRSDIKLMLEFIQRLDRNRPDLFEYLQQLVLGAIICLIVEKNEDIHSKKFFKPCKVFIDTNVVFSILGYHHDEISRPCQELHLLLLKQNYKLAVFDFTLQEVTSTIKQYEKNRGYYSSPVPVDSIYSKFALEGKTVQDIREIVANLETILWEKNIKVVPTGITLDSQDIISKEKIAQLLQYNPNKASRSAIHDLLAIEQVKKVRRKPVYKFSEAGAFFLTADLALARYNYNECGHRQIGTVGEVILDRFMTNILWFQNPSVPNNLPIYASIAANANTLFVDRVLWKKFMDTVNAAFQEGKISESDLAQILYNENIWKNFNTSDESDAQELFDKILEKSKQEQVRIQQLLEQKDDSFKKIKLELEAARKELAIKEQENSSTLETLKTEIKNSTGLIASAIVTGSFAIFCLLSYVIWYYLSDSWGFISFVVSIVFTGIFRWQRNSIHHYLFQRKLSHIVNNRSEKLR